MSVYLYVKALHIISMVCWFAGLFYLVRLFVYHAEAKVGDADGKKVLIEQFIIMERRLWYAITNPAMVATVIFGMWLMQLVRPVGVSWFSLKLVFVGLLLLYHFQCGRLRKKLLQEDFSWSSKKLRLWNEVATLLLFAIVLLAVLKSLEHFLWGMLGFLIFAAILVAAVKVSRYAARCRERRHR